jgi:hypothetical protein
MAFVIADRVRETTTTTGTGNITLAGAVGKFRAFSAVLSTGDTTYYSIVDQSGTDWEVGIGTFTAPSTLARTTILSSSNSGNAVNFTTGTRDVFITLPAPRTVTSISGGTTGLTPSSATYGNVTLAGTLAASNGGTGQTSFAVGDLLYASTTTALSKLADVATGNALISGGVGVAPSYGKIGLTTHVSGTLPVANGGTNGTTAAAGFDNLAPTTTQGDIIYRGASSNTRLAAGTTSQVLIGGTTPSWGAVTLTTMVTGTLPVGNGGTGTATAFTTGSVVFANSSGIYNQNNSQFFWDNTNTRLGIGTTSPDAKLTVNGVGAFGDGSVSAPGITNTGDLDTGIYFSAANTIDIATGGTAALQLDSSQNLKFNSGYGSVATAYACRAWVNFNGTGTVAIRASGNVTSITDNGTGDYTVNMTNAMPDANYSYNVSVGSTNDVPRLVLNATGGAQTEVAPTTAAFRFFINNGANSAQIDCKYLNVAVFR